MPEEKENHSMTVAKVRTIYFGMFITLITTLVYPTLKQLYPELLETDQEHKLIKEEAEKIALNFPELMDKKHEKEAQELEYKFRMINNKIINTKSKIGLLSEDLQSHKQITDEIKKQTNFNTYHGGLRDEALFDLMKKDEDCEKIRYSRRKVDRYTMFNDWYEIRTLQPIIAGSDCRTKVNPFDRNSIQIR